MKIAITGSNGFIAKNLIYNLVLKKNFEILKIDRKTKKNRINNILKNSDIIFHKTVNGKKNFTFKNDNVHLTKYICDYLLKII